MPDQNYTDFFPGPNQYRTCRNPECRRTFRPRSKYNPGQVYCCCEECNRSRNRQRQWKHNHPELARRMERHTPELPPNDHVMLQELLVDQRLLWLIAGVVAFTANLRTTAELLEMLSRLISAGCRLCGLDQGMSVLNRLFITGAAGKL